MEIPGQSLNCEIIIFSGISMDHHPTSFFILENTQLGTFWVGQAKMSHLPAVTRDGLIQKLETRYPEYGSPCLHLVSINKNGTFPFYGVERWLSKLEYKLKQSPHKHEELRNLLTAGWHSHDFTINSTLNVLHSIYKTDLKVLYRRLLDEWESRGMQCLNTTKFETRAERYQRQKCEPDFLKAIGRKKVLHQMKKTGKLPKPETLTKYEIKEDEVREIMGPKGIIYKITSPSGKVYVGQTTKGFEKRIRQHKSKTSNCTALKNAINKYGDEMKYEIIEEDVPQEHLDEREIYWIKELNSIAPSGYNLNSGGGAPQIISQEAKDRVQMGKIKSKVEKDGYMGDIRKSSDDTMFYPRIRRRGKHISLSTGGFRTEEEAIEVLREYTRYPENFTTVENRHISRVGSVYPTKNRLAWILEYKRGNYLGTYKTQEEAWKALERYIEDPVNFSREHRKIGSVRPKGNRWIVSCKGEYLGHYITEEEGYKALEEYNKDPEKFLKGRIKLSGSIFKSGDKWRFNYKGKHIGYYHTKEEAEEARQALQSS